MQQIPKLGQDVHYHDQNGRTFAAKVVKVHGAYSVNLIAYDDGSGTLGAPIVSFISVSWATTYGWKNGWSYAEAEPIATPAPVPYRFAYSPESLPAPEPNIAVVPPASATADPVAGEIITVTTPVLATTTIGPPPASISPFAGILDEKKEV